MFLLRLILGLLYNTGKCIQDLQFFSFSRGNIPFAPKIISIVLYYIPISAGIRVQIHRLESGIGQLQSSLRTVFYQSQVFNSLSEANFNEEGFSHLICMSCLRRPNRSQRCNGRLCPRQQSTKVDKVGCIHRYPLGMDLREK